MTYKNAVKYDFPECIRGDSTDSVTFSLVDPNQPSGLVGAVIDIWIRNKSTLEVVKKFSSAGVSPQITITDPTNCVFIWSSFIVDFPSGKYSYDIQITYSDGTIKTRFYGDYPVFDDVTKTA